MTFHSVFLGAGTAFLLPWLHLSTYDDSAYPVFPTLHMRLGRPHVEGEGVFAAVSPYAWLLLAFGVVCLALHLLLGKNRA
ncbi:hypothetical protein [Deinococcus hopiensis]|uniref:Uncharacterized protein n=1 Tax=Deinococcus hopiensis KR-140 TaxID=695939 RepID=A0A1W1V6N2_9DEIO|nr:hypothetical protein [Deinococcus hopiensis]SMB88926.1 hypothetical protein SAMN00790413_00220 [Deinococcus hopiensis KR-140]